MSRVQLALNVPDIDQAVDFYSKLFATEPAKRRPGYANFAIADPPLKLVLFEKADADIVLSEMERVSRDRVVLLTPSGFVPQPPTDDEPWQEHRCGFAPDELQARGYVVTGVGGLGRLRKPYGAFRGGTLGKVAAAATVPLWRHRPDHAFHLLAIRHGLGG